MSEARELTPGDRRELRSVVKNRFRVLRAEVKRREQELLAEIEKQLLDRYRAEDEAVREAKREASKVYNDAMREIAAIGRRLNDQFPDLSAEGRKSYDGFQIAASNPNRAQIHRAAMAAIPDRVGDANLALDRQEIELLQHLSVDALESDAAREFLAKIPTVGQLVPTMRLAEIEAQILDAS